MSHHWSGWPGAWCFDCGDEDAVEHAMGCRECHVPYGPEDTDQELRLCVAHRAMQRECPEPGSNRHNPYVRSLGDP